MTSPTPFHVRYTLEPESCSIDIEEAGAGAYGSCFSWEVCQSTTVVGALRAQLLRFGVGRRYGHESAKVIDRTNKHLHDLERVLVRERIRRRSGDVEGSSDEMGDVLFIESMKVVGAHRGRRLGLMMVERLADILLGEGSALLVLRAKPIEPFDENKPENWDNDAFFAHAIDEDVYATPFSTRGEEAAAKLRAYFGQLGMKRVDGTDYMVLDGRAYRPRAR